MKIVVLPSDLAGCGHYRMIYPGEAVAAIGIDVQIVSDGILIPDATVSSSDDKPWEILSGTVPDADVVVIQRPSHPSVEAAIRYLKSKGIRIVVDIDDRFEAIQPSNRAAYYYKSKEIRCLNMSIANADVVTCSTPELAELHGGILLENCVPESYLNIPDEHENVIGWSGTLAVHRDDLRVVGSGVSRTVIDTDWGFRVVGESTGVGNELGLPGDPEQTGWLPIGDYPAEVAKLGIGIAPLADTVFNRSKSWLKTLEYSALGVPFVATDLPEYRRLGVGLLASNQRQWKGMLSTLLNDPMRREDMRLAGRAAARQWTYEKHAERWADVWVG
jgi:glycosyltransferase involved in cell wall biosynthesis